VKSDWGSRLVKQKKDLTGARLKEKQKNLKKTEQGSEKKTTHPGSAAAPPSSERNYHTKSITRMRGVRIRKGTRERCKWAGHLGSPEKGTNAPTKRLYRGFTRGKIIHHEMVGRKRIRARWEERRKS